MAKLIVIIFYFKILPIFMIMSFTTLFLKLHKIWEGIMNSKLFSKSSAKLLKVFSIP